MIHMKKAMLPGGSEVIGHSGAVCACPLELIYGTHPCTVSTPMLGTLTWYLKYLEVVQYWDVYMLEALLLRRRLPKSTSAWLCATGPAHVHAPGSCMSMRSAMFSTRSGLRRGVLCLWTGTDKAAQFAILLRSMFAFPHQLLSSGLPGAPLSLGADPPIGWSSMMQLPHCCGRSTPQTVGQAHGVAPTCAGRSDSWPPALFAGASIQALLTTPCMRSLGG